MFKLYTKTAFGLVLLCLIYFLALVPLLVIRTSLEHSSFLAAVAVWGLLAAVFFLPAAAMIVRKVWFFAGTGEPIVLDLLLEKLLEINSLQSPVAARKQKKKIIVSWRINDQDWCEKIEKTGMKKLYELWLSFDNRTKTVSMADKHRSVNWDLSPIAVKTGWTVPGPPFFGVTTGNEWGVENYKDAVPEDYRYTPDEIKSPVLNTILKNGWNVRFSLF